MNLMPVSMALVVTVKRNIRILVTNWDLNFDLLVDTDYKLSEAVGVYQLKNHLEKNPWV